MIKSEYLVRTKEFVESELECVVDQLVELNTNWILESMKLFGNMQESTKENKYTHILIRFQNLQILIFLII